MFRAHMNKLGVAQSADLGKIVIRDWRESRLKVEGQKSKVEIKRPLTFDF
jgi:hypothetical protein